MKGYFKINRKQRFGIVILSGLIVFLVFLLNVNDYRELGDPTDVELTEIRFDSYETLPELEDGQQKSFFTEKSSKDLAYQLFEFDPNELSYEGWVDLGFSEKQAASIVSYRSNYGPFKKPADVQKLYVVSEEKFEEIKPYMVFPETEEPDEQQLIEINSATQEQLQTIRGIGPVFSERIIKRRKLLGGYATKDQFKEVYGMTDEAFEALASNVSIDQNKISKINLNEASKDELRNHPYLKKWEVTSAILTTRQKSPISDLKFLIDQGLMTQSELDRLQPYIQY